jgi:hypothetical protein
MKRTHPIWLSLFVALGGTVLGFIAAVCLAGMLAPSQVRAQGGSVNPKPRGEQRRDTERDLRGRPVKHYATVPGGVLEPPIPVDDGLAERLS